MGETRFRIGARSFTAGETVFHTARKTFATVGGLYGARRMESAKVLLHLPNGGGEYGADPDLLIQDVGDEFAFHAELAEIAPGIAAWFLAAWRGGCTLADCKHRLRVAGQLAGRD